MPRKEDRPTNNIAASRDIALRLLQFQQRLDALDNLYNEEVGGLKTELKILKGDFVRQQTPAPAAEQPRRTRRRAKPRPPTQHAQEELEKEAQ